MGLSGWSISPPSVQTALQSASGSPLAQDQAAPIPLQSCRAEPSARWRSVNVKKRQELVISLCLKGLRCASVGRFPSERNNEVQQSFMSENIGTMKRPPEGGSSAAIQRLSPARPGRQEPGEDHQDHEDHLRACLRSGPARIVLTAG